MADCLIPPWVLPESPETLRWIDDATQVFPPSFGRGMTQRGSMADPRWGLRRRYRGLRQDQLAAIRQCLNESRGQLNKYLVTPHTPLRGSFPTSELLPNPTFANSTTGWTTGGAFSLTVSDRVMRAVRTGMTGASIAVEQSSTVTVVQYAPYVQRFMFARGRGAFTVFAQRAGSTAAGTDYVNDTAIADYGLASIAFVPRSTTAAISLVDASSSGVMAGDYISVPYASLSRCALADNGVNDLQQSDTIDNAYYTSVGLNATTANNAVAPDGTTTGDTLNQDTSSGGHYRFKTLTGYSSAAADYAGSCSFKAANRGWAFIVFEEQTGTTSVSAFVNLSSGALGTVTTGANWSNARAFVVAEGNSWYRLHLVARKTNAATSIQVRFCASGADNTFTYAGSAEAAISVWRASFAASSVPIRGVQTVAAAATATAQSGGALYVKGLPVSTDGLLEIGDWCEVAGQLKQTSARLNSDAAGLGYWQFRPALGDSPADNDPIIINQPFGRFIYSGGQKEMENQFGLYGEIEMNLEEVYS